MAPPSPSKQRYFVDAVRYRIYLMRQHIEQLEASHGGESLFRCGNRLCAYECTALEAQQRHSAVAAARARRDADRKLRAATALRWVGCTVYEGVA